MIALMKNARELWEQDVRLSTAGEAVMKCNVYWGERTVEEDER
jgi:hypothetical protein